MFSKRVPSACSSSSFLLFKPICCPAHGAAASAACTRYSPCRSLFVLCQNILASSCSSAKQAFKLIEILAGSAFCFLWGFLHGNASTPMIPATLIQSRSVLHAEPCIAAQRSFACFQLGSKTTFSCSTQVWSAVDEFLRASPKLRTPVSGRCIPSLFAAITIELTSHYLLC